MQTSVAVVKGLMWMNDCIPLKTIDKITYPYRKYKYVNEHKT